MVKVETVKNVVIETFIFSNKVRYVGQVKVNDQWRVFDFKAPGTIPPNQAVQEHLNNKYGLDLRLDSYNTFDIES